MPSSIDLLRAKLTELTAGDRTGLIGSADRCERLLREACNDKFPEERAALVAAVAHGVTNELLGSSSSSELRAVLITRLTGSLAEKGGVSPYLARWSIECWAVALMVVPEGDWPRLMISKLEALAPLIEWAGSGGSISAAEVERLVAEGQRRGIDESCARGYLSAYLASRGWQIVKNAADAAPGPPASPVVDDRPDFAVTEPTLSPWSSAPPRPRAINPPTSADPPQKFVVVPSSWPLRIISGAVISLLFVGLLGVAVQHGERVASLRPENLPNDASDQMKSRTGPDHMRQQLEAEQSPLGSQPHQQKQQRKQADLAASERRTYDAARGDSTALRAYLDNCRICEYQAAARSELATLTTEKNTTPVKVQPNPQSASEENAEDFVTYRHYDLPGNDLSFLHNTTLEGCITGCESLKDCRAYSFDQWNHFCSLKASVGTLILNPQAIAGILEELPKPPTSEAPVRILKYLHKSISGNDFRVSPDTSVVACEESCRGDESCLAYTFFYDPQSCRLFSDPGEYFPDPHASSGVKLQQP
jgi:hypothetical protein